MCGIAGELRTDAAAADVRAVRAMADALAHRGPDDADAFAEGPIALGFRRLSIQDLSLNGRQPFWTDDRSMAIVFNGEVYNFREIARELRGRGYHFRSGSDAEVVLDAIHCWGLAAALRTFIGMFAFALWDARSASLTLCRDRAGVKPLYYHLGRGRILFASEMKGLLAHPDFPRELSPNAVGQYFVLGYSAGDATVFRDTHRVLAGHYLTVTRAGEVTRTRYWSIEDVERGSFTGGFDDACERLQALCDSAFGYRLIADVPVAMFLSGGIDSTLVSAVLRKRLSADLLHLTIGFRESAFDEAPKAAEVARQLGVRHVVRYLEAPDAGAALQRFVDVYDEPFADTSGIPTTLVSAVAREHVKVALSADGGDEQFCGYDSYGAYARNFERLRLVPGVLRRAAGTVMRRAVPYELLLSATLARASRSRPRPQAVARYEKLTSIIDASRPADLLAVMNEKAWTRGDVGRMLRAAVDGPLTNGALGVAVDGIDSRDALVDAMMRMDYGLFMRDDILTKVDRASMAVSLECREPMLDHRIAEFAFSLPLAYLCGEGQQKRILKRLLQPWISSDLLGAPKWGFSIPLYQWMRGPWRPFVNEYLSPSRLRAVGVLDERAVISEVRRFYRHHGGRAEKIFTMLNFQMWAERWLRPASAREAA